ncbi:MAG: flagellar biosynthesis anti-sigma factor FlgM [Desulfobacteraceae bacterium]
MEISNKVPSIQNTAYVKQSTRTAEAKPSSATAKGDQVALSAKAKELQAAREAIKKMDEVDHEKVAEIKAQLEAGTYKVDAEKIAGKMIEESLLKELE